MPLSWPLGLPAPLQGSFSETLGDNKIVSPVAKGRRRKRKKFSTRVDTQSVTIKVKRDPDPDKDGVKIFKAFYAQLNDGVDTFTFNHPIEGELELQFGEGEPQLSHERGRFWNISFNLETVP